jgi:hypothetical protein
MSESGDIDIPFYGYATSTTFDGSYFHILLGILNIYTHYKDTVTFPMCADRGHICTAMWKNGLDLEFPDELWETLSTAPTPFIAIPLFFHNDGEEGNHMNILLYDKNNKEFQRYDPNGFTDLAYNSWVLDETLKFGVMDYLGADIEYIPPDSTCPVQNLQDTTRSNDAFCAAWCLWFLELRLSNVGKPSKSVESIAYNLIKELFSPNELILGYADFLIQMKQFIANDVKTTYGIVLDDNSITLQNQYVRNIIQNIMPLDNDVIGRFERISI